MEKNANSVMTKYKYQMIVPLFLIIVAAVAQNVLVVAISKEIVQALVQSDMRRMGISTIFLCVNLFVATLVNYRLKREKLSLIQRVTYAMEDALLEHHKRLASWRTMLGAEDILGIIKNTAAKASGGKIEFIFESAAIMVVIIAASLYAIRISLSVFVLIVMYVVVIIWWMRRDTQKLPKLYEVFFEHNRVLEAKLWEQVKNHEVASFLNQEQVQAGYKQRNEQFISDLIHIKKIDNKVFFAKKYGPLLLMVLVVLVGGYLHRSHALDVADIYAMVALVPALASAILAIPSMIAGGKEIAAATAMLNHYFGEQEIQENEAGYGLDLVHDIEFRDVGYSYAESSEPVLRQMHFTLRNSRIFCLAGLSGSGKSTVLLLLMKFIECTAGEIRINGIPLQAYHREQYFAEVGYASQNPTILPGTIEWNIVQNRPYDAVRLQHALEDTAMTEWLSELEEGIDTYVTADSISSGERQKICIARLLYRSVHMLILDEATSAIDPASEQLIISAIARRAKDEAMMVIYSTHNPALLAMADDVLWIENGQIAQQRKPEEGQA